MNRAALISVALTIVAATPAHAGHYRHYRCSSLNYDYSHSSLLSPLTYVFPSANWGPFFYCRMYYSPVEPPSPDHY